MPNAFRTAFVAAVLLAMAALLACPDSTLGHAAFVASDPPDGAVLSTAPPSIRIRFSEPLESAGTGAEVLDTEGAAVAGISSTVDPADPFALVVSVPDDLPAGGYAVSWRNLSAVDGHPQQGFFSFAVGAGSAPVTVAEAGGSPWERPAAVLARWLGVLGLTGLAATWPLWLLLARPVVGEANSGAGERARRIADVGFALGVAAALLQLVAQGAVASPADPLGGAWALLGGTRWGWLWLARVFGAVVLFGQLHRLDWQRAPAFGPASLLALGGSLLLPLPFAMNGHAAAAPQGAAAAVVIGYLHLLGAALWAGGLATIALVVAPAARRSESSGRMRAVGEALRRFSGPALAVWLVLATTGLYAAWAQVGSFSALLTPGYGRALLLKLLLLLPILGLAAANRLAVTGRMPNEAQPPEGAVVAPVVRRVRWEVALALPVLLLASLAASSEPARGVWQALQPPVFGTQVALTGGLPTAHLAVSPAATGDNRFVLEAAGPPLPDGSEALLRVALPERDLPPRSIPLARTDGNRFEGNGVLPAAGAWSIEVVVRRIGAFNAAGEAMVPVGARPSRPADPAPPAVAFAPLGAAGVVATAFAAVAAAVAAATGAARLVAPSRAVAATGLVALTVSGIPAAMPASDPRPAAVKAPPSPPAPFSSPPAAESAASTPGSIHAMHGDHDMGSHHAPMSMPGPPPLGGPQEVDGLRIDLARRDARFAVAVHDGAGDSVADAGVVLVLRPDGASASAADAIPAEPVAGGGYETAPVELDPAQDWRITVRVSPKGGASRSATWRVAATGR